ncbi:MAG: nucleoside diphosphate kinase regulator [Micropepsaceae bacterium]
MKIHQPPIVISAADHQRLAAIAESAARRDVDAADDLLVELDRADVVADDAVPADVVRMGSTVTFRADGGEPQTVTLVYPADADIDAMRISVLTPVGAALIGMKRGETIDWTDTAGRARSLEVETVA